MGWGWGWGGVNGVLEIVGEGRGIAPCRNGFVRLNSTLLPAGFLRAIGCLPGPPHPAFLSTFGEALVSVAVYWKSPCISARHDFPDYRWRKGDRGGGILE